MSRTTLSRLLVVALIVALVFAARSLPVAAWLVAAETWIDANPVPGALAYVCLTAVSAVALLPGWVPMALAGVLFGLLPGIAYGTLGIALGATAAMLAGRTLARPWVADRIAGNEKLLALDQALDERAFLIVFLTRASMVLPFNVLNYAYGLTRVGIPTYIAATALGMLPVVALYVYLGTLAEDIGAVLTGEVVPEGGAWLLAAGIAVVATLLVVVRRTVNRVLERRLGSGRGPEKGDEQPQ